MANNQNSETKNTTTGGDNKTTSSGAASTKQAKETSSAADKSTSQSGGVMDMAKDTLNQVKESAGTVTGEAIGQAKEKASSVIDDKKTMLATGVASVADSIRQVGENLGNSTDNNQVAALASKYGETLAGQVERLSSYLDEKEIRELVTDVEQFARRNPLLFVGGAFALGVLAARFMKSSGRNQKSRGRSKTNG
jgi:ElaB/YqjD/DUF883 family membrane-anchored ribosome-binding protein